MVWLLEGPTPILYMSFMVFMVAKVRFLGMLFVRKKKIGKIFPKMFGVLKNVVFLQPQTKGH
jgi:hypothetical protein